MRRISRFLPPCGRKSDLVDDSHEKAAICEDRDLRMPSSAALLFVGFLLGKENPSTRSLFLPLGGKNRPIQHIGGQRVRDLRLVSALGIGVREIKAIREGGYGAMEAIGLEDAHSHILSL